MNFVEGDLLPRELDRRLLRQASMEHPGDPYRYVLGAVARELANRELSPQLTRTDDFVVFIAEHDEGYAEKLDSIRRHNPPDAVRRWEAAWRGLPLDRLAGQ